MRLGRRRRARAEQTAQPGADTVTWNRIAPWPIMACVGALLTALAGWLFCAAWCLLGWLSVIEQPIRTPLHLAAQLWVLSNGVGITQGGIHISLIPLGVTIIVVLIGSGLAAMAAEHSFTAAPPEVERWGWLAKFGSVFALTYALAVVLVANLVGVGPSLTRAVLMGLVLGAVMGVVGIGRALDWNLSLELVRLRWPRWFDVAPRAFGSGVLTLVAGGAAVLTVALLRNRESVAALTDALNPGTGGGLLLVLIQLFWLPNFLLWAISWTLGAGFSIGTDTLVSPVANNVGVLPGVPIFGVLPDTSSGVDLQVLWIGFGILAACVATWAFLRSFEADRARRGHQSPRPDLTGIIGGVVGVLLGLLVVGLAALSRGDFGSVRLVGIGPIMHSLLVIAPTTMGIAGLGFGVVYGALDYRRMLRANEATIPLDLAPSAADAADSDAELPASAALVTDATPPAPDLIVDEPSKPVASPDEPDSSAQTDTVPLPEDIAEPPDNLDHDGAVEPPVRGLSGWLASHFHHPSDAGAAPVESWDAGTPVAPDVEQSSAPDPTQPDTDYETTLLNFSDQAHDNLDQADFVFGSPEDEDDR